MQLKFGHDYFNSYLKNLINHSKINKCYKRCHHSATYIHWISGHADIPRNEKADALAKLAFKSEIISSDRFLSFYFIKNQIINFNQN